MFRTSSKLFLVASTILLSVFLILLSPSEARADSCRDKKEYESISCNFPVSGVANPPTVVRSDPSIPLKCTVRNLKTSGKYVFVLHWDGLGGPLAYSGVVDINQTQADNPNNSTTFIMTVPQGSVDDGSIYKNQVNVQIFKDTQDICRVSSLRYVPDTKCSITVKQQRSSGSGPIDCYYPGCMQANEKITVTAEIKWKDASSTPFSDEIRYYENGTGPFKPIKKSPGTFEVSILNTSSTAGTDDKEISFTQETGDVFLCKVSFPIVSNCVAAGGNACEEEPATIVQQPGTVKTQFSLCSQVSNKLDSSVEGKNAFQSCEDCQKKNGVWTAIGCISADPELMIAHFIRLGISLSGGVALLMTLIGGFLMTTSQGNPKQQEQAKEMITSAVIGLLFVLFSVVLLQFIGVTILQIPGFGASPTP